MLRTFFVVSLMVVSIKAQCDDYCICGPDEVYRECCPCAAINCGDTPPEICSQWCENPGCYCRDGYLRNENGTCIPECQCRPHEVYRDCQPCAAINCGETSPIMCSRICQNPGCYCEDGYLRNKYGICVPACQCRPNEVYRDCAPCAAINCGETPPEICIDLCQNPGCYCRDGYLRNENGICVPECQCRPHEVYRECQPCAAINCGETAPDVCPYRCQNPGCYCEDGYLRNEDGICVSECQCRPNEVYMDCKPCAAINCGETPPAICTDLCRNSGCYCKEGYLRNEKGICVPEYHCHLNEVYRECKPCAAIYCGEIPPEVCIALCEEPGYYCKDDYLRNEYGICVPKWQC